MFPLTNNSPKCSQRPSDVSSFINYYISSVCKAQTHSLREAYDHSSKIFTETFVLAIEFFFLSFFLFWDKCSLLKSPITEADYRKSENVNKKKKIERKRGSYRLVQVQHLYWSPTGIGSHYPTRGGHSFISLVLSYYMTSNILS